MSDSLKVPESLWLPGSDLMLKGSPEEMIRTFVGVVDPEMDPDRGIEVIRRAAEEHSGCLIVLPPSGFKLRSALILRALIRLGQAQPMGLA